MTIKYTIKEKNFKYHLLKGLLLKGSLISTSIHPIHEVEAIKQILKVKGIVKLYKNSLLLKEDYRVGLLMAYNLCNENLIRDYDIDKIILDHALPNDEISDGFSIRNLRCRDNIFYINCEKNARKISQIFKLKIDENFFTGNSPNEFNRSESFVANYLFEKGVISQNYRHGLTQNKECDIVDEELGVQIEIITEFKSQIKKNQSPIKDYENLLLEMINTDLIKSSSALIEKFVKKEYSDKFQIGIAIFTFGTRKTYLTLLEDLSKKLHENPSSILNNYKSLYLITIDFLFDNIYFISSSKKIEEYKIKYDEIDFLKKEVIKLEDMNDNDYYYFVSRNIFNGNEEVSSVTKSELKDLLYKFQYNN